MKLNSDFKIVVMTRFNLAIGGGGLHNQPDWLGRRFALFERYCLPSMAAQTARNFEWMIYFDIDTPRDFRERIEACRKLAPFIPYYTPLFEAEGWPRSLTETFAERTPWLLTVRLDNDDGLALDHMERLQAAVERVERPERSSFNFTNGMVLHGGKVYAHDHRSNAFASWLEPWDAATRTSMSINHMKMAEHGPIVQIGGPAAWLQVVHESNVSNKIRGRRVKAEEASGRFAPSILKELKASPSWEVAVENAVLTPLRAGRDRAIALLRSQPRMSRF